MTKPWALYLVVAKHYFMTDWLYSASVYCWIITQSNNQIYMKHRLIIDLNNIESLLSSYTMNNLMFPGNILLPI